MSARNRLENKRARRAARDFTPFPTEYAGRGICRDCGRRKIVHGETRRCESCLSVVLGLGKTLAGWVW